MKLIVYRLPLLRASVLLLLFSLCPIARSADILLQDIQGNPISNAEVYWIHDGQAEKLTPQAELVSTQSSLGVLVIRAEGFQYTGLVLGDSTNAKRVLSLRGTGEPNG